MDWLIRLIMKFWGISNDSLGNPEIIIPHGYGLVSFIELMDASKKTTLEAAEIAKRFPEARVVFASQNYFWEGSKGQEDSIKLSLLVKNGVPEQNVIAAKGICNTLQEVLIIFSELKRINCYKAVVVVDQMHARSARLIWEKLAPEVEVRMHSIKGLHDSNSPLFFQKSQARWLFANILRHVLFIVFGKRIIRLRYIRRKI